MRGSKKGFTLIELVIVLVLIGILAAVAIPRFHDMKGNAEEAAIRGTLGNVRSAITITRANLLANGTNAWPTFSATMDTVLDTEMPDNPWAGAAGDNTVADASVTGDAVGEIDASGDGWQYDPATGDFWANTQTATTGSNENEW